MNDTSAKRGDPDALRLRIAELELSERNLKQLLARQAEELGMFRTLLDTMPDYIFFKDIESRFIVNNKAHLQILNAAAQADVAGKTDFDIFPGDLATRYYSDEQVVLRIGKPVIGREEPARSPDGKPVWLSTTKVPVRNAEGKIMGLVGISRDITELKRAEADLQAAKDELETRVRDRTRDLKTANEGLAARIAQLDFLNTASYQLAQFLDINELGDAILMAFISRFPTVQCALCLCQKNGLTLYGATSGFSSPEVRMSAQQIFSGFPEAGLDKPVMVREWSEDPRVSALRWPGMEALPCYIIIPLVADKSTIAVIQIFTTAEFAKQYDSEIPVLNTLAVHAALCLSNAFYLQEQHQRARLQGELDAARTIQQRFTPTTAPCIPRIRIKGLYSPAHEVGGDYLDYFQTDEGRWVIVIADVCGKGMPAALFMAMLRNSFRMLGRKALSAKALLCSVNEAMKSSLDEKAFVTALCLVIDAQGTSMSYSRAGHPHLVRMDATSGLPAKVACQGPAFGLISDCASFDRLVEEVRITLEKGDRFLLYTDGLTETIDPDSRFYGIPRLFDRLSADGSSMPDSVIDRIMTDLNKFKRGCPFHDDLTILAMTVE
jgi:PAS domain S-box-containing protein